MPITVTRDDKTGLLVCTNAFGMTFYLVGELSTKPAKPE